jgi:deoxyadenosine/deoxycytidine kinase
MKQPFYNDQLAIAEQFIFIDTHICQMAQLAHQKINTLKLSYYHAAYCNNHNEIYELVKRSLLNFVTADFVLAEEKFLDNELDN